MPDTTYPAPCEECGSPGVDPDCTGADGRAVCDDCRDGATLDQTSETLADTLREYLAALYDRETIDVAPLHTGGGCMVLQADLSQDGRGTGRALWLTREEDWILGFYDFSDPDLDLTDGLGVCVTLWLSPADRDNPAAVAEAVAGILARLGVTTLQGG